ncbi:hypothetical protein CGRA01v4_00725 [Colletotrichum graminicola]|nr:hypothetical protein CGRA01v4_00725 [Colletotrichum graminicola]
MGGRKGWVVVGQSRTTNAVAVTASGWLAVTLAVLNPPQQGNADANTDVMRLRLALGIVSEESASIMDRSDTVVAALSDRRMTREIGLTGKMRCDSVGKRCYLS